MFAKKNPLSITSYNTILRYGVLNMFWDFAKKRSPISVTNLNSQYLGTMLGIEEALGQKVSAIKKSGFKNRLYVLDFDGDIMASQAEALTHEVTAILFSAQKGDKVLVRLTSPGGAAHAYGYAASQLERLVKMDMQLIIAVDKIAASGGYMMACIANHIIAAPYAIVGSIGVVAEFPNFSDLLKNLGIDYKQYTAGKYKRTVSTLGEITVEGEEKFREDLATTYNLFKKHVADHRPKVDIDRVATGEHWQAVHAVELGLVDQLLTAEEFILEQMNEYEVVKIAYIGNNKTFLEKVTENLTVGFLTSLTKVFWRFLSDIKLIA